MTSIWECQSRAVLQSGGILGRDWDRSVLFGQEGVTGASLERLGALFPEADPRAEGPTSEVKAAERDRREEGLPEGPGEQEGQTAAGSLVAPGERLIPGLSMHHPLYPGPGSRRNRLPEFSQFRMDGNLTERSDMCPCLHSREMAELEFELLSGWSLNVPASQNIRPIYPQI